MPACFLYHLFFIKIIFLFLWNLYAGSFSVTWAYFMDIPSQLRQIDLPKSNHDAQYTIASK